MAIGIKKKWEAGKQILSQQPAAPGDAGEGPLRHANPRGTEVVQNELIVQLREKLGETGRQLEQARERQIQLIDPKLARPSTLMNRHESSFQSQAYFDLVTSVKAAGGNEQPAFVRRLQDDPEHQFEIIAGLRRHRAALETGTLLKVAIEEVDDRRAYDIMSRENSARADLSPWEWGRHYLAGLAIHQCNQKELAERVGMSEAHVHLALPIGMLPEEIVNAFPSPLDIQFAWGKPLTQAVAGARDRVIKRARELVAERSAAVAAGAAFDSPREVFAKLIEVARRGGRPKASAEAAGKPRPIHVGKVRGLLAAKAGRTTLELKTVLPAEKLDRLEAFVKALLGEPI
jgi:ParB family chromosome partitioning protein